MSYDKTYKNFDNVFGREPEEILVNFSNKINKEKPVLDIGSGQGRNSIYLAENGFYVEAIDPSIVAVETLSEISQKRNLNINTFYSGYNDFKPLHESYSAILVFGLIQILSYQEINKLINKINEWATKGSLLFITAFGDKDSGFEKYSAQWKHEKENSFTDGEKNYRTFFKENEMLKLFPGFKVLFHKEGWGKEHHHGDGVFEKHYMIETVFEK